MGEKKEVFMRILVLIVSGIILGVWRWLIFVLVIFNWIYVLFSGKRSGDLAEMCETWNTQFYVFVRYLSMVTNERPFPFKSLTNKISKFDSKIKK